MAHLQANKIERVRDASRSDGGRVDAVDCGPFPTGELNLNCEAFLRGSVFLPSRLEHQIVSNECEESPASLVGRSVCSYRTESREEWCGVFRQEFRLLNEADVNAVIAESES